jgi:hypothetical protein
VVVLCNRKEVKKERTKKSSSQPLLLLLFSFLFPPKISRKSQAPMAETCNLSYLGGGDQEDHISRIARANSSW